MKTFTESRVLVDDPHYCAKREESLRKLRMSTIDAPIVEIIEDFRKLPYCFTLQSCCGHFICKGQRNRENIRPLFDFDNGSSIEYRIAYVALCIQNSDPGRQLLHDLAEMTRIDPEYVQFGSADWFWRRMVNSYALQVEPERHKTEDRCRLSIQEALHVEKVRNQVFRELRNLIQMKE